MQEVNESKPIVEKLELVKDYKLMFDNIFRPISEENYSPLLFMSKVSLNMIKEFFNKEEFESTLANAKRLRVLWKKIIIDAIHFLRINDRRERMFKDKKQKTTMHTSGAAEMAIYNAYGIEELHKYFEKFTDFESTLYGADKYYRDHVVHPLMVWLIGLLILDTFGKDFNSSLNIDGKYIKIKKTSYTLNKIVPSASETELHISPVN